MAIVKQSTSKPFIGEMRKIGGVIKEWDGNRWITYEKNNVRKQPYNRLKNSA